eukprot:TCALIF_07560-PA protein Name:"Protein of unknown function" AED:0.06 eAED:0.06 QI:50/1/0.5/1/1/0.5/2/254/129
MSSVVSPRLAPLYICNERVDEFKHRTHLSPVRLTLSSCFFCFSWHRFLLPLPRTLPRPLGRHDLVLLPQTTPSQKYLGQVSNCSSPSTESKRSSSSFKLSLRKISPLLELQHETRNTSGLSWGGCLTHL